MKVRFQSCELCIIIPAGEFLQHAGSDRTFLMLPRRKIKPHKAFRHHILRQSERCKEVQDTLQKGFWKQHLKKLFKNSLLSVEHHVQPHDTWWQRETVLDLKISTVRYKSDYNPNINPWKTCGFKSPKSSQAADRKSCKSIFDFLPRDLDFFCFGTKPFESVYRKASRPEPSLPS